jgi:hypothetical protein
MMRMIWGTVFSIVFPAVGMGIAAYVIRDDGMIDPGGDRWSLLASIAGSVYGAICGVLITATILSFRTGMLAAAGIALLVNLLLGAALVLTAGGGGWSPGITKLYYFALVICLLDALILAWFNSTPPPIE